MIWRHTYHVDGVSEVDGPCFVEHATRVQAGVVWRHAVQHQRQTFITIIGVQFLGVVQQEVSRRPRPWPCNSVTVTAGASAATAFMPATVWMSNASETGRSIAFGIRIVVVIVVDRRRWRRRRRRWCGSWCWQHLVVLEPLDFDARPANGVTTKSNWIADRQRHLGRRLHRL